MTTEFVWQIVQFSDGSNPYVCKTRAEFNKMKRKYEMHQVGNNIWMATAEKCFAVVVMRTNAPMRTQLCKTKSSAVKYAEKVEKGWLATQQPTTVRICEATISLTDIDDVHIKGFNEVI